MNFSGIYPNNQILGYGQDQNQLLHENWLITPDYALYEKINEDGHLHQVFAGVMLSTDG